MKTNRWLQAICSITISAITLSLLGTTVLSGATSSSKSANNGPRLDPIWPMPARTDLSSGFGDYRSGRFHYGLDLRTGPKNLAVVAPVDGYVSQVWLQYFGYGKALYLAGDDGRTYVFAHLARYAPSIDKTVRKIQVTKESYNIREWFEPSRYRVRQGDTLAFSGKTGIGAPHMHFEIRDSENVPRSPLQQGLSISDKTGPLIKSLTFRYLDYQSLFATGKRTKTLDCNPVGVSGDGAAHYNLSSFPYLSAPYGVTITTTDYPTNKSFNSSPRELRYKIGKSALSDTLPDGTVILYKTQFKRKLDSLKYGEGALSLDVYDQARALRGEKNSFLLYQRLETKNSDTANGNVTVTRPGRVPARLNISARKLYGVYPARIEVTDASGNLSVLDYSFCYGPPGDLFEVTDIGTNYALLTTPNWKLLDKRLLFSELLVYELKENGGWGLSEKTKVTTVGKGAFRITVSEHMRNRKRVYRAVLKGRDGWYKPDVIFSNVPATAKTKVVLKHHLTDGGLYVTATTSSPTTDKPELQALSAAGIEQNLPVHQVGANTFSAFVPYNTDQETIVTLRAYIAKQYPDTAAEITNLHISVPPSLANATKASDNIRGHGVFYAPIVGPEVNHLLELHNYKKSVPQRKSILAGPFYLGPNNIRYDSPTLIRLNADSAVNPASNVAICSLSKKADKWNWFTTDYNEDFFAAPFSAETKTNGIFALMIDNVPPQVTIIRPANGKTLKNSMPRITARIADELSGIWADTLFDIRLDGQWLIPEYDNEDKLLVTEPNQPLKAGEHTLVIRVRDNAGNQTQRKVTFRVQ